MIVYSVKFPSKVGTIIGMSIVILNSLFMLRMLVEVLILQILLVFAILLGVVVLLAAIYEATRKATNLRLYDGLLVINGRILPATEIKQVMTSGYFKPVVGILPHGRIYVPLQLTFRFAEEGDEDQAFADLKRWAERNQVRMTNKHFRNWI